MKSELSGNFEKVMVALLMEPVDYDAYCIKKAVKGAGTNERALVEILCSRTNEEIQAMKASYLKSIWFIYSYCYCYNYYNCSVYQKDMEKAVGSDVSGHFKRILMSLMTVGYGILCSAKSLDFIIISGQSCS